MDERVSNTSAKGSIIKKKLRSYAYSSDKRRLEISMLMMWRMIVGRSPTPFMTVTALIQSTSSVSRLSSSRKVEEGRSLTDAFIATTPCVTKTAPKDPPTPTTSVKLFRPWGTRHPTSQVLKSTDYLDSIHTASSRPCVVFWWEVCNSTILSVGWPIFFTYGLNTHRIIFEDILKATGKLGRQPHKGHLPR